MDAPQCTNRLKVRECSARRQARYLLFTQPFDPLKAGDVAEYKHRVSHHVLDLGFVDSDFGYSSSAPFWADEILAEGAEQLLGKMSGTSKSKSTQPRSAM